MEEIEISLWRNIPPTCPLKTNKITYPLDRIFPSGRQAISHALNEIGLSRSNRIAIPEWSSHCVISAVGKITTPLPFTEALTYNINVDGILLYEQWGWPIQLKSITEFLKKFNNAIIILDRVDSSDIDNENRIKFYPETVQVDIISLSKILGLTGGGLAKLNGNYLSFRSDLNDDKITNYIWNNEVSPAFFPKLLYIQMSDINSLHPRLIQWLSNNDLSEALQTECLERRINLSLLINSSLSSNWPDWMLKAFKNGAGPGIAPLFKNAREEFLTKAQKFLLKTYGIETSIYHFNWSGNPLIPKYEKVLAFPIHGLLKKIMPRVIDDLTILSNP